MPMASNTGIGIDDRNDADRTCSLERDKAWYSITLTNYDKGQRRKPFEELAAFLTRSMSCLFDARPHWGKLCPLPVAELRSLYPAFAEFRDVCERADNDGVFRNPWTAALLQSDSGFVELS